MGLSNIWAARIKVWQMYGNPSLEIEMPLEDVQRSKIINPLWFHHYRIICLDIMMICFIKSVIILINQRHNAEWTPSLQFFQVTCKTQPVPGSGGFCIRRRPGWWEEVRPISARVCRWVSPWFLKDGLTWGRLKAHSLLAYRDVHYIKGKD